MGQIKFISTQSSALNIKLIDSTNNHDWCKLKAIEMIIYITISLCYFKCSIATPILLELVLHMLESCSIILSGGKNIKLIQDVCVQNKYKLKD